MGGSKVRLASATALMRPRGVFPHAMASPARMESTDRSRTRRRGPRSVLPQSLSLHAPRLPTPSDGTTRWPSPRREDDTSSPARPSHTGRIGRTRRRSPDQSFDVAKLCDFPNEAVRHDRRLALEGRSCLPRAGIGSRKQRRGAPPSPQLAQQLSRDAALLAARACARWRCCRLRRRVAGIARRFTSCKLIFFF